MTLRSPDPVHQMRLLPPSRVTPAGLAGDEILLVDGTTDEGGFTDEELENFEAEAELMMEAEDVSAAVEKDLPPPESRIFDGASPASGKVWVVSQPPPGSALRFADQG